ncbi:hypothetical protein [Sinomicrobium weinanense]|uniref:Uncharacterized protein n=1 Tax=Sinomicrobium weinanense TaxID=2842200 RepID=A0A926Q2R3_9FLAO|nr:hypothetical protein [Sinomicrobium weinanense]MBC9795206.1 hypothetical protein [Sinomicrobium weinanense]MBU3121983.1 hypothetical protein [Sinomicrobium weinanense]
MKRIYFTVEIALLIALLSVKTSFGQQMRDKETFTDTRGIEYRVGDDLLIGYPSDGSGDFKYMISTTEKKLGWLKKAVKKVGDAGKSIARTGAEYNSAGTYNTGQDASGKANSALGLSEAGDRLLSGDHDLTGRSLRILRFSAKGNKRRGERFYAIVAGPGNGNYEIEIIPAIRSGELAGINGKLFDKDKPE